MQLLLIVVLASGCSGNHETTATISKSGATLHRHKDGTQAEYGPDRRKYDRQFSIIIGIDEYKVVDNDLEPLQHAVNDAREIRELLQQEFGFNPENCLFLTNQEATLANVKNAICKWLPEQMPTAGDALIIFFSGHGLIDASTSDGYLATINSRRDQLKDSCIDISWLRDHLGDLDCQHKLVILDSCYSGSLFQEKTVPPSNLVVTSATPPIHFELQRGNGSTSPMDSLSYYLNASAFFGMSAGRFTPVADGLGSQRHSVFTSSLLQVLRDRADSSRKDHSFTFRQIASQVESRVANALGSRQIPDWGRLVDGDGDFVFTPTVRRLTPSERSQYTTYANDFTRAADAYEKGNIASSRELLGRYLNETTGNDCRGFEWYYLWRECHRETKVLTGHTDVVTCIAFTPDNKTLVSGGYGEIRLWDITTYEQLPPLKYNIPFRQFGEIDAPPNIPESIDGMPVKEPLERIRQGLNSAPKDIRHAIHAISLSPTGDRLATACDDETVKVWDLSTRTMIADFSKQTGIVHSLAFSPDGKLLVTGGDDDFVKLWDIEKHNLKYSLPTTLMALMGHGHDSHVSGVAFSPDGTLIATCSPDRTIRFWNPKTGVQTAVIDSEGAVAWISFSGDGSSLAAMTRGNRVSLLKILDVKTRKFVSSFTGDWDFSLTGAFSSDGTTVAAVQSNNRVVLFDVKSGTTSCEFKGHTDHPYGIAISPDGKMLATCGVDRMIRIWPANLGNRQLDLVRVDDFAEKAKRPDNRNILRSIALSPDGLKMATTSDLGFQLWDLTTNQPIFDPSSLPPHWFMPKSICFSPDGKIVVGVAEDETQVFEVGNGKKIVSLPSSNPVEGRTLAFSSDGSTLATVGNSEIGISLWNTSDWTLLATIAKGESEIIFVSFTPTGNALLTASSSGNIKTWDVQSKKETSRVQLQSDSPIVAVALSPDGHHIALGAFDHQITVSNLETNERELVFGGHGKWLSALEYSPDGKTLVSAGGDFNLPPGEVVFWQATTGNEMLRIRDHRLRVSCLAFSVRTRLLVTGSDDGFAKLRKGISDDELSLNEHSPGKKHSLPRP